MKIAIIDSGIDYSRAEFGSCSAEDFASGTPYPTGLCGEFGKIIYAENFVASVPEKKYDPMDDTYTGTLLASILAGAETSPYPGVAPEAKLAILKVCTGQNGPQPLCDASAVHAALKRAADPNNDGSTDDHFDIVFLGLWEFDLAAVDLLQPIEEAIGQGMVVVASAGMGLGAPLGQVRIPALVENVLTVGSRATAFSVSDFYGKFSAAGVFGNPMGTLYGKPDLIASGEYACGVGARSASSQAAIARASMSLVRCEIADYYKMAGPGIAAVRVTGALANYFLAHPSWKTDICGTAPSPSCVKQKLIEILLNEGTAIADNPPIEGIDVASLPSASTGSTLIVIEAESFQQLGSLRLGLNLPYVGAGAATISNGITASQNYHRIHVPTAGAYRLWVHAGASGVSTGTYTKTSLVKVGIASAAVPYEDSSLIPIPIIGQDITVPAQSGKVAQQLQFPAAPFRWIARDILLAETDTVLTFYLEPAPGFSVAVDTFILTDDLSFLPPRYEPMSVLTAREPILVPRQVLEY